MDDQNRARMVDMLVERDIDTIKKDALEGDFGLLDSVLRGEGFVQYNNLCDDSLLTEFVEYALIAIKG